MCIRDRGVSYPPPGFSRQYQQPPNTTPGLMNNFSGRNPDYNPSQNLDRKWVTGRPFLNNPK
eukprot:6851366-Prorocentrum_lima.AAC.1